LQYLAIRGEENSNLQVTVQGGAQTLMSETFAGTSAIGSASRSYDIDSLQRGAPLNLTMSATGRGTLYYDLVLRTLATGNMLRAEDRGFNITRTFHRLGKEDPQSTAVAGTTHAMTITITAPKDRHYVAIEAPIPAGMELIDTSLQTSQQVTSGRGQEHGWGLHGPFTATFSRVEFRDDRLFLFADELQPGVYAYTALVRATTPGTYQVHPAHVEEMYFPETFGQSDGETFVVTP
jgi:uncharacterized protein YfaS (alpha-2-macroglobulin family)